MLFLMSGNEGSIGYSFFSDAEITEISLNFGLWGDEVESEPDDRDLFSGEGESGGEFEFEFEPLVARNFSRENFKSWNCGDTTITSKAQ